MFNQKRKKSLSLEIPTNVRLINWIRILKATVLLWPVITLIYLSKGLSFLEIGTLNSIGSLIIAFLEVPLGMVADRLGRKRNFIIGQGLTIVFLVVLFLSRHFFEIVVAEVIFSVATCFISGTDTSIVYDSLKYEKKEKEYGKILSSNSSAVIFVSIFVAIIATYAYSKNRNYIYLWSLLIYTIVFLSSFFINEEAIYKEEKKAKSETEKKTIKHHLFTMLSTYKTFIFVSLFSALIILLISNLYQFSAPILVRNGMPVEFTGYIIALSKIVSILLLRNSDQIINLIKTNVFIFLTLVLACLLAGLLFVNGVIYWSILICLSFSISDFLQPIISKQLNELIDSHNRTTMLSITSLLDNAFFTVGDPVVGYGIDKVGYNKTFGIFGVLLFLSVPINQLAKKKRTKS